VTRPAHRRLAGELVNAPAARAGRDGEVEYEAATAALGGGMRGEDPQILAEQGRWTLVAQIDTDDRAGMMWGDCGALYWLSRRDEMTASRLAPTSFTWQCA